MSNQMEPVVDLVPVRISSDEWYPVWSLDRVPDDVWEVEDATHTIPAALVERWEAALREFEAIQAVLKALDVRPGEPPEPQV